MADAFRHIKNHQIDSLNVVVEEYQHNETGAMHYHMAAENPENVFLVALRTVPTDSTGVAHILEHTSLCGSKKYPVRDPFFMMIRRSLNTFMNAFTSSDWTAYPFASQNKKDFFNLLEVYLDAVFFARLDELDFAQEGHRLEFAEPNNPSSELEFKGVVFNEMKGAMSSPVSVLWQTLTAHLFPETTYHHNSGGEPENIPDLTYEQLTSFYKMHYHPSNAIFMTFGDIPAAELQDKIHGFALGDFKRGDDDINIGIQPAFSEPKRVVERYALQDDLGDLKNKTHIVLGWMLGESTHIDDVLRAHLLSSVLLDNSASPLRDALETSTLGQAPSPLCGLEDSNRQMSFACGLEGANEADADETEHLIISVLKKVANEGISQEHIDAAIHQLELSQREVGGDSYPYGLQLILSALGAAVHRGDPVATLDVDEALERLRKDVQNPDFIPSLVRSLLIDNPHRVRLVLAPDLNMAERQIADEKTRLANIAAKLSDSEKQAIVAQAAALNQRQMQEDDPSILPKVTLSDVPETMDIPVGKSTEIGNLRATNYARGTNGLCYQQIIIDLPELDDQELRLLPAYTSCLTELGVGDQGYRDVQAKHSAITGGVGSYVDFFGKIDNEQDVSGYFVLSTKSLTRNHRAASALLVDTLQNVRFDEHLRIKELMAQRRMQRERSITGNGHALAMSVAASGYAPTANISERLRGLTSITELQALDDSFASEQAVAEFAAQLSALHQKLMSGTKQCLLIGEQERLNGLQDDVLFAWQDAVLGDGLLARFQAPQVNQQVRQAWHTNTQVNFCAKAYKTVPAEHPDAAALSVLGGFLKNGYLHRAIREQGGAYGGGASHDSSAGAFRFYSYRDPRIVDTLADFDNAIDWMLSKQHSDAQLEEAILGVISSIDKPGSPAGDAKQAFHYELQGRSAEKRILLRRRILQVTIDDLKRVTKRYLVPGQESVAVVTSPNQRGVTDDLGLMAKKV